MLPIQCANCKHFRDERPDSNRPACDAFPDGMPPVVLTGEHDHRKAYPGDNGIRFEPIEGTNESGQGGDR